MARTCIEAATSADRAAVVALLAEDLEARRLGWKRSGLERVFDALLADERQVVRVLREESGGTAVGVLVAHHTISIQFAGPALWIEQLYVGLDHRRRGYGRELVEALLDLGQDEGMHGIDLEAYHGNDGAALLYRSLGFRRLGRERFQYRFAREEQ